MAAAAELKAAGPPAPGHAAGPVAPPPPVLARAVSGPETAARRAGPLVDLAAEERRGRDERVTEAANGLPEVLWAIGGVSIVGGLVAGSVLMSRTDGGFGDSTHPYIGVGVGVLASGILSGVLWFALGAGLAELRRIRAVLEVGLDRQAVGE